MLAVSNNKGISETERKKISQLHHTLGTGNSMQDYGLWHGKY
jgi:hypothetical protein